MKNSQQLKQFLMVQMHKLAEGEQGVDEAKAICNYAAQVYNQTNLELKQAVAERRFTGLIVRPIDFGGTEQ